MHVCRSDQTFSQGSNKENRTKHNLATSRSQMSWEPSHHIPNGKHYSHRYQHSTNTPGERIPLHLTKYWTETWAHKLNKNAYNEVNLWLNQVNIEVDSCFGWCHPAKTGWYELGTHAQFISRLLYYKDSQSVTTASSWQQKLPPTQP